MTTPLRLQGLSPEEKLAAAQREAAKWTAIAADPAISPSAAAFVRDLARSANAEVDLRLKGLGRQQQKSGENPLAIPADQLARAVTALDILAAQRRRPASS